MSEGEGREVDRAPGARGEVSISFVLLGGLLFRLRLRGSPLLVIKLRLVLRIYVVWCVSERGPQTMWEEEEAEEVLPRCPSLANISCY